VYLTIVNLFVEYIPKMKLDSFTISIVTAIVLKPVLEGFHTREQRFKHFFCHVHSEKRHVHLWVPFSSGYKREAKQKANYSTLFSDGTG
jgi:hypothetical protein